LREDEERCVGGTKGGTVQSNWHDQCNGAAMHRLHPVHPLTPIPAFNLSNTQISGLELFDWSIIIQWKRDIGQSSLILMNPMFCLYR
jgi:hypothetical protein